MLDKLSGKVAYLVVLMVTGTVCSSGLYQGLMFIHEPPSRVIFYNNTGAIIPCTATGALKPEISWSTQDNVLVNSIPGLRNIREDGALVFPPFSPDEYRQDVHSAVYKCSASNNVGAIFSRDVTVRGVLYQDFDIRVYDEFVVRGNIGILRCSIPSYVRDYVVITSWKRDDGLVIVEQNLNDNSKFVAFPSGELHVRNVEYSDTRSLYNCQVLNTLTQQTKESVSGGKFIINEPRENTAPRLTHTVRHVKVEHGRNAFLPCAAQGYPVPRYRWTKRIGGQLLTDIPSSDEKRRQLSGVLVLSHVTPQDSGDYSCSAFNEAGEVRSETQLTVTVPIKVSVWPSSQTVNAGSSATLNCTITGYPASSIEWMKNQRRITASRRVAIIGQTMIHISAVQREDRGIYQCFVRNDDDSSQASSYLSVASDPPVLLSKFEEIVVDPGDTVSLRCSAVGNPLPQITWFTYDLPVTDSSRIRVGDYVSREGSVVSFVNISRAEIGDGGQYQCRASNEYGIDMFSSMVHVRGPPTIRQIKNVTAIAGDVLVIYCPLSGYPIHTVKWRKGKKQLPLGRRQKVYANGTLLIQGLDGNEDEGHYNCEAENNEGFKASSDVHIRVIDPPTIVPFFLPKNIREGSRASLTCSVSTGDPPIHISWLKDDRPLNFEVGLTHEKIDEFISTVVFKSLKQEHSGIYTCVAQNEAALTNYSVTLSVNAPPRWRLEPNDQYAAVNDRLVLDCVAYGRPDPRVIWKKLKGIHGEYRTVISGSRIQTLVNGSLVINEVEQDDDGRYMCEASNGVGSPLSTVITLTVHVPAHFKQKFFTQTVKHGETATMSCEAYGEKPVTYTWLKDRQASTGLSHPRYMLREQMLDKTHISELTIHVVERQDNGIYTCIATNAFGQDERNNQLIVQERPDPPSNLESVHTGSRNVVLKWSKPYNGNSPITKYILEYTIGTDSWNDMVKRQFLNGDQLQLNVQDLNPITKYSFRVYAENAVGRSIPSVDMVVVTDSEVPGSPPKNIRATATDSKTIRVSWDPPLRSMHHGSIRGYYVGYRKASSNEPFVYKTVQVRDGQDLNCDVTDLERAKQYAIAMQAFNEKGAGPLSDEIVVRTLDFDPPSPPLLKVESVTSSSIELRWESDKRNDAPVSGFILRWRESSLEWREIQIPSEKFLHNFTGLGCGSRYQFYILAFNSMGKGQPSDVVSAKTEGSEPIAPREHRFIARNSSTFLLRLNAWRSGGCPINFFVIQYKHQTDRDWTLLSPKVEPIEESVKIPNLMPGSWYNVLVSAHNGVGVTEVEYVMSTLTPSGGTIVPDIATGKEHRQRRFKSLSVIVPVASAVLVLIAISIAVFFLLYRKRSSGASNHYEGVRVNDNSKGDILPMSDLEKTYAQSRESIYFPSPYATSRVGGPPRYNDRSEASDDSRSVRHHRHCRSDHLYDMPQQITDESRGSSYKINSQEQHPRNNIEESEYEITKSYHMQRLEEEERLNRDIAEFIIHEKMTVESAWSPKHRWRTQDIIVQDMSYSPLHHTHPQTLVVEGPELSDAECDRDLRLTLHENNEISKKILV